MKNILFPPGDVGVFGACQRIVRSQEAKFITQIFFIGVVNFHNIIYPTIPDDYFIVHGDQDTLYDHCILLGGNNTEEIETIKKNIRSAGGAQIHNIWHITTEA